MHSDYWPDPEFKSPPCTARLKEDAVKMPHFDAAKTRGNDPTDGSGSGSCPRLHSKERRLSSIEWNLNSSLLSLNKDSRNKKMCTSQNEFAGGMSPKKIEASIDRMDWKMKLLNNRIENVKKRNTVIMKSWKKQLNRADKAEIALRIKCNEIEEMKATLQKYIDKENPKYKESLKSTLTCAICLDLLYEPISLPNCTHKFCKLCWVKCALHAAERGALTQCPQCRIYESGVDFAIDTTLWSTIQLLFPNECYLRSEKIGTEAFDCLSRIF